MNGKRNILFVDKDAYPSLEEPELFETLATGAGSIRVERIVSNGQVTPEGEWYDQDLDEWVVVLEGEARLHYMDGEEVGLKKGIRCFCRSAGSIGWFTPAPRASGWLSTRICWPRSRSLPTRSEASACGGFRCRRGNSS